MVSIEDGLYQLLAANPTVIAAAPDGIWPVTLPANMLAPETDVAGAASYRSISDNPTYTLTAKFGLVKTRIEFNSWASTYPAAKSVAAAINSALDFYQGTLPNGVAVKLITSAGGGDSFDQYFRLYRVQADYMVQYTAA